MKYGKTGIEYDKQVYTVWVWVVFVIIWRKEKEGLMHLSIYSLHHLVKWEMSK